MFYTKPLSVHNSQEACSSSVVGDEDSKCMMGMSEKIQECDENVILYMLALNNPRTKQSDSSRQTNDLLIPKLNHKTDKYMWILYKQYNVPLMDNRITVIYTYLY